MNFNRFLILAAVLGAIVLVAACVPGDKKPGPVETAPLLSFDFIIEAEDKDELPVTRVVGLTITAFDAEGKIAVRKDPTTGTEIPYSIVLQAERTPFTYHVQLEPGVVNASLTVTFFGIHEGDRAKCHIEQNGAELPGTRNMSAPVPAGGGMVLVTCLY